MNLKICPITLPTSRPGVCRKTTCMEVFEKCLVVQYAAMTTDECNAADGRFSKASWSSSN
jgi:hypothetical protein